jgi:hypothetical protein
MFFRERTPEAKGPGKEEKVSQMTNALPLFGMFKGLVRNREDETRVPEPEFKPFRFPRKEAAAQSRTIAAVNVAREPRTLEELGVAASLARELEATLQVLGATRGDRVIGYTFATPDGTRYALRLASAPGRDATGIAA